ncbi:MAG: hypothetical protein ABJB85_11325 [Nitrososphaerota archaeon]
MGPKFVSITIHKPSGPFFMNRKLIILDRYPTMTVRDLLYLIECRIEGEKFVISSYRWSVEMLQLQYDNRDNLERLYFIVWHAGNVQWED